MWGNILLWFWFAFPRWLVMLCILLCACWPSVCFGKMSVQFLCSIFNYFLILSYLSSLSTLDINLFLNVLFENIFSHSVGSLLNLLIKQLYSWASSCSSLNWWVFISSLDSKLGNFELNSEISHFLCFCSLRC